MARTMAAKAIALDVQHESGPVRLCEGYSFGADKSIAGELVFCTGMVGYEESITDPSYRGQILVMTYPLIGNYGVPSRETRDPLLQDVPAHFESAEIHIAGLIVASYCGEDYSHHLATSSLGTWLKEQGVPAMCGIDSRALTKKIRDRGSMLGRLRIQTSAGNQLVSAMSSIANQLVGSANASGVNTPAPDERFEEIPWTNPNTKNLVADGMTIFNVLSHMTKTV